MNNVNNKPTNLTSFLFLEQNDFMGRYKKNISSFFHRKGYIGGKNIKARVRHSCYNMRKDIITNTYDGYLKGVYIDYSKTISAIKYMSGAPGGHNFLLKAKARRERRITDVCINVTGDSNGCSHVEANTVSIPQRKRSSFLGVKTIKQVPFDVMKKVKEIGVTDTKARINILITGGYVVKGNVVMENKVSLLKGGHGNVIIQNTSIPMCSGIIAGNDNLNNLGNASTDRTLVIAHAERNDDRISRRDAIFGTRLIPSDGSSSALINTGSFSGYGYLDNLPSIDDIIFRYNFPCGVFKIYTFWPCGIPGTPFFKEFISVPGLHLYQQMRERGLFASSFAHRSVMIDDPDILMITFSNLISLGCGVLSLFIQRDYLLFLVNKLSKNNYLHKSRWYACPQGIRYFRAEAKLSFSYIKSTFSSVDGVFYLTDNLINLVKSLNRIKVANVFSEDISYARDNSFSDHSFISHVGMIREGGDSYVIDIGMKFLEIGGTNDCKNFTANLRKSVDNILTEYNKNRKNYELLIAFMNKYSQKFVKLSMVDFIGSANASDSFTTISKMDYLINSNIGGISDTILCEKKTNEKEFVSRDCTLLKISICNSGKFVFPYDELTSKTQTFDNGIAWIGDCGNFLASKNYGDTFSVLLSSSSELCLSTFDLCSMILSTYNMTNISMMNPIRFNSKSCENGDKIGDFGLKQVYPGLVSCNGIYTCKAYSDNSNEPYLKFLNCYNDYYVLRQMGFLILCINSFYSSYYKYGDYDFDKANGTTALLISMGHSLETFDAGRSPDPIWEIVSKIYIPVLSIDVTSPNSTGNA